MPSRQAVTKLRQQRSRVYALDRGDRTLLRLGNNLLDSIA